MKSNIIISLSLLLLYPSISHAAVENTVIATMNVGVTPDGLAVTPDNKFVYVANNNNPRIPGIGIPKQDSVTVLNATNNTVVTTIFDTSFNEPFTVTINAAGTKAYVTNSNGTTVSIIDIATNTVSGVITGFDGPSGFAITPDGRFAYVNNYGAPGGVLSGNGTTVRVVDLNTNTIVGPPITVGLAPAALAVTLDGKFVYVICYVDGNPGTGVISIIRTSDNTVVGTIPGFSGPFQIAMTPNGQFAYVTNFGSNNFFPFGTTVSAVNLNTNNINATITVGIQPSGIDVTPDSRFAYVANYDTLYTDTFTFSALVPGQGTVNIIDIATNTVLPPTIAVAQSPSHLTIAPNGKFAYVTNFTSNVVNVIALPTFKIVAQGCRIINRYVNQIDVVNRLTWTVSGLSLPVVYSIYRDAALTDLAGTVLGSGPFIFFDHNRNPNVSYTYYIVGTNDVGTTSVPVVVPITQNC